MPIHVRAAEASDLDFLVHCNAAMARETEGLELDSERLRSGVRRVLEERGEEGERPRGHYRVASEGPGGGAPLGALLVTREWSDWRDGWFWWIQSVFVEPAARRRGVLRALYQDVLDRARARPDVCGVRLYVERSNRVAHGAYLRLGMRESGYRLLEVDLVLERPAEPSVSG